jgi:predicted dehydrogenase
MMSTAPLAMRSAQSPASARALRRVAVIGGGKISEQHLSVLRRRSDVSLATVCDLSPSLARFSAERTGALGWTTDYREILASGGADVIHVLTPPATHQRIVADCLRAGADVVVEKPIALNNADFRELWSTAAGLGRRLVENHNYRFNDPMLRLRAALDQGLIGDVVEVEVRMNLRIRDGGRYADGNLPHPSHQLPAGVLHEFISHLAYLYLHVVPKASVDAMERVDAAWRNHGGGGVFKFDDLDAAIEHQGIHGRIRFSARGWPDCLMVSVRGSRGFAVAELFQPSFRLLGPRSVGTNFTPLVNGFTEGWTAMADGVAGVWGKIRNRTAYGGLARFLDATYDALRDGTELPVTYAQMDETTRFVDRLLDSRSRR